MVNIKPTLLLSQIRIIGGHWRSRKLSVLNSPGLRPTMEHVRETLFNWLAPVIKDAFCLDCFAGSGALGLEARSRGAASVTLLEKNRTISDLLLRNIVILEAQQVEIITTDSLAWLAKPGDTFDIVFIDPPFYQAMVANTIEALEHYRRLKDHAWIYIETEITFPAPDVPIYWKLYREKIAGQVVYRLYMRHRISEKSYAANN
ncbi:16S rRNA (guanine(966)-N(2))-methyltransferase RsmD [Candidatus Steffania adelgidicola]|uniref:16S rRNA (guanine(966)-N(2))-methyltransferase RsmD n=1 Tax=Candidatus Steffania adelgidicola TaxID=1076626 RepID=UPI001D028546|nr:16S rRNA (guanine(966)-N(2))-methyltransferase RsmD [Candidatus Steffania adelgidicola]UDG80058.1 Ribosomal RNA small subunit methyltransferase D [Candidatus Steffania adelgidicola]